MAIRLITGVPGSGKSFYGVSLIVKNYCELFGDEWRLKDNIVLISNIDGLVLDHYELSDLIKKAGSVKQFFSYEWQQKVFEKFKGQNVVYAIDECQRFFDRKFYDRSVFEFFELHRHLGMDIFLFAHSSGKIAKDLRDLIEIETRAVNRTLSLGGFNYVRKAEGEVIAREVLRYDKRIFALYKSMSADESIKVKKPYFKYACYLVGVVVVFFVLFNFTFARWFKTPTDAVASTPGVDKSISSESSVVKKSVPKVVAVPVIKTELKQLSYLRRGKTVFVFDDCKNQFVTRASYPHPIVVDLSGGTTTFYAKVPVADQGESTKR